MTYTVSVKQDVAVKYLKAEMQVRYWEDGIVDGKEDTEGDKIPLRDGDNWNIVIDLERGIILDWPMGTTASVHYKVCDAGCYTLLNNYFEDVMKKADYVPAMLCPKKKWLW